MRRERAYLGARKLRGKVKAAMTVEKVIADWTDYRIKSALGVTFRERDRIILRRPIWMPGALYRWLMRTVVVERDSAVEPK